MDFDEIIRTITIYALPIIFAITLHEAAHAYAAKYFGDTTAYSQGRMSLNPLVHIDPMGTIVIPLVLALLSSPFLFGYAKPVPVNFGALRNPKRDMAWVALAGPASNFVMAIAWAICLVLLQKANVDHAFFIGVAEAGIQVNLVLFALNLIPLPPLDGGRIMFSLLPHQLAYKYAKIEPYGFFILIGLMFLNVLKYWMIPVLVISYGALDLVLTPIRLLF
jgi:Zn-dependent protease